MTTTTNRTCTRGRSAQSELRRISDGLRASTSCHEWAGNRVKGQEPSSEALMKLKMAVLKHTRAVVEESQKFRGHRGVFPNLDRLEDEFGKFQKQLEKMEDRIENRAMINKRLRAKVDHLITFCILEESL